MAAVIFRGVGNVFGDENKKPLGQWRSYISSGIRADHMFSIVFCFH